MLHALIQNYVVVAIEDLTDEQVEEKGLLYQNVILVDNLTPPAQIGWLFDGNKLHPADGVAVSSKKITRLSFRNRFTLQEKGAIYTVAKTNVGIQVWLDDLAAATFVDLARADTIATVNQLAAYGFITSARAAEILNTPVTPGEAYLG